MVAGGGFRVSARRNAHALDKDTQPHTGNYNSEQVVVIYSSPSAPPLYRPPIAPPIQILSFTIGSNREAPVADPG